MIKNNKGFTLIEIMIVISIMGVLFLTIGTLLNNSITKYNHEGAYYESKINARYAMNRVANEIRRNYDTSFDAGKIKASDTSTLVNSNKNEESGNICYYYDADRYGLGDGYGELRGPNGEVIAKYIKDFTIENIDIDLVKVTIKGGRQNDRRTITVSTYVRLYN